MPSWVRGIECHCVVLSVTVGSLQVDVRQMLISEPYAGYFIRCKHTRLNAVDGGDVLERGIIPGSSIGSNPG